MGVNTFDFCANISPLLLRFLAITLHSLRIELAMAKNMLFILVKHPDEINEIFDRISYGKGASIIRMMDKFLTSDSFKKVIFINDAKLLLIRG